MKTALSLIIGVLLGGFGLLVLQNLGFLRPEARAVLLSPTAPGEDSGAEPRSAASEALIASLEERIGAHVDEHGDLDLLAILLEDAKFDGDWAAAEAAAQAIRRGGVAWLDAKARAAREAEREARAAEERPLEPSEVPVHKMRREVQNRLALRGLTARHNAATALLGRSDAQAIAVLTDLLGTAPDVAVRRDAAHVLARMGDERGLRALVDSLRSPETPTRDAAASALALVDSLEGAEEMAELMESGATPEVMLSAAAGLARYDAILLGEPHPATEALRRALAEHRLPEVRALVAASLEVADLHSSYTFRATLAQALQTDTDEPVRLAAARTLRRYADTLGAPPDVVPAAARRLTAEDSFEVREQLLGLLAHGDADTIGALEVFAATAPAARHKATLDAVLKALHERLAAIR